MYARIINADLKSVDVKAEIHQGGKPIVVLTPLVSLIAGRTEGEVRLLVRAGDLGIGHFVLEISLQGKNHDKVTKRWVAFEVR